MYLALYTACFIYGAIITAMNEYPTNTTALAIKHIALWMFLFGLSGVVITALNYFNFI